jgi:hypothetical protein
MASGDAIYVTVPASALPSAFAYGPSVSTSGKLIDEMGAALEDPSTGGLASHLVSAGLMDDLGATDTAALWSQLLSSSDARARTTGLAGQIRAGSPSALALLAATSPSSFGSDSQDALSMAICGYSKLDASGIAALGALSQTAGYADSVQFCATHALRSIHSAATLPYLAQLLDSTSLRLQYEAVAGIASFVNGFSVQTTANVSNLGGLTEDPIKAAQLATPETRSNFPTIKAFNEQPAVYTAFWKVWLAAHPGYLN